jgi:hypothetical protein
MEKTMRVRFLVNFHVFNAQSGYYDGRQKQTQREIAALVLRHVRLGPYDEEQLRAGHSCVVECSPEEFVRFQMARRDAGYVNNFRSLKVYVTEDDRRSRQSPRTSPESARECCRSCPRCPCECDAVRKDAALPLFRSLG